MNTALLLRKHLQEGELFSAAFSCWQDALLDISTEQYPSRELSIAESNAWVAMLKVWLELIDTHNRWHDAERAREAEAEKHLDEMMRREKRGA